MKRIVLIIASVFILSACDDSNKVETLRKKIEDKKINSSIVNPEKPELKQFQVYNYQNAGLKSPFRTSVSELKTEKKSFTDDAPDENRIKDKLEEYDLASLKMTGTIKLNGEELQAILESEDGKVFIVEKDNYIGRNNGKISDISATQIMLEEVISNGDFSWQKRPATITMNVIN